MPPLATIVVVSDLDSLRATAHPIRLRLLSLTTGAAMSAAEAARDLGVSQASASYHFRVLERAGLVRVVEVVKVRGGEAKRYRHESSAKPFDVDAPHERLPLEDRQLYVEALVDELRRRSALRIDGPALSTDAELWIAPELWRRVVHHIGQATTVLHAGAQRPRTPGTVPVSMTLSMFPLRKP